jgi:hypothetical protein
MHRELLQLRTEKEQTWREITHLKRTEEKAQEEARTKGWWQFWKYPPMYPKPFSLRSSNIKAS